MPEDGDPRDRGMEIVSLTRANWSCQRGTDDEAPEADHHDQDSDHGAGRNYERGQLSSIVLPV